MELELNLTAEDLADEGYKEYFGKIIEQQSLIVAARRIPMRAAHLMGMRVLHPRSDFMTNYFDCDDRPTYHSNGTQLKVGSQGALEDYAMYGTLVNGAMEFDEWQYVALPWPELKKSEMIHNRDLSRAEAKAHTLWFELSQQNQGLLDAFVDTVYKQRVYAQAMRVYLDSGTRAKSWMRAFFVGRLIGSRRSMAYGNADLGYGCGRLVGIAPEALVRLEKRLRDEQGIRVDFVGGIRK